MMNLCVVSVILCAVTLAAGASTDAENTTLASDNGTSHTENPSGKTAQPDPSIDVDGFHFRKAQLNCRCGKNSKRMWRQKIEPETAELYYRARDNATLGFLMKQYSFLEDRNCTKCTIHYVTCHGADETYYYNCIKRHLKISRIPRTFFIERSDRMRKKRFVPRSSLRIIDTPIATEWNDIDTEKNDTLILLLPLSEMSPSSEESTTESEAPTLWRVYEVYFNLADTIKVPENRMRRVRAIVGATIPMPPTCRVPAGHYLKTASLKCKLRPSSMTCVQKCLWGYTLPSGIIQVFRCNHSEDKWVPHRFRECKPFVDCGASLFYPGTLKCTAITHKNGPTCKISCLRYEDMEEVPEDTYTCDINGKWDKTLPFCAGPGTGINLVTAPNKTLHSDTEIEI